MNQQDKSFLTTFVGLITMLVLLAAAIFLISRGISVVSSVATDDGSRRALTAAERLAPVGRVVVAEPAPEGEQAVALTGEQVTAQVCAACHQAGVLGAPMIGNAEQWSGRLEEKGLDTLVTNAVNGINAMPAKGGNPSLTEQNIHDAIVYMLDQSGVEAGGEAVAQAEVPATEAPAAEAPATEAAPAAGGADLAKGEQVYNSACFVCHAQGVAGAPKLDDTAAWEPRVAKGMETLVNHAINGFNAMPPKGGNMSLSDEDVGHAVAYMVAQSGAAPAAAAPAAEAPAAEQAPAAEAPAAEQAPAAEASTEVTAPSVNEPPAGMERPEITPSQGSESPAQEPPSEQGGTEGMIAPEGTDQQAPAPSAEQTEAAAAALQAGQQPAEGAAQPAAEPAGEQPAATGEETQGRVEQPAPLPDLNQEQAEALEQAVDEPAAPETQGDIQQQVGAPGPAPSQQSQELTPASETAPQGNVKEVPTEAASAQAVVPGDVDLERGKQLYNTACVICHGQGVAGAPMLTDQAAWAPRLSQGFDTLVNHAINGYKAMPPKGGRMDVPDEDIRAAVGYMASEAQ